ncbi:hypothetical protein [Usitatibacter palustris]|uniref:Uncharacterized protein n=1 Tax=Usitatibacter palustris TaxID=2732487 RepID=A0A6M4H7H4_9PROT|nr:hypothetical protein [Usitatibacter palustris]QJR15115.1 hypothetical protein DSM104440_01932 [Usitatibacter palustris]
MKAETSVNVTCEDTARTLGVALGVWAIAITSGTLHGSFARLDPVELGAVALSGFAYALVVVGLDRGVRNWLDAVSPRAYLTVLIEADVLIAVSAMLAMGLVEGPIEPALARFPLALIALFVAPATAAAHVIGIARLLRAPAVVAPAYAASHCVKEG